MAQGYRILTHWNQWLMQQHLGHALLESEQLILSNLLANHFGKHALLVGVPNQKKLLDTTPIPFHTLLSPLLPDEKRTPFIETDLHELPVQSAQADLVILPHTLQFVDNPRQLLAEACRIIKPEGMIAITGFNPYSFWGIKKHFTQLKMAPWSGNFIEANKIKNWLQLHDFKLEKKMPILFRPPIAYHSLYHKLHFMERLGQQCFPFLGGAYILFARAKVIPLTPIRLKWKQQLNGIRISTTISGNIARKVITRFSK